ncbi:MAG TPA: aldo/keto reductase [Candidatus Competibacteraceae bacterium]|nr:aldo/keto reductase [Candidatus Competibacteraceae bacterium]
MELRELGSSGIRVSPLGLGTVKFGRNQEVKYPQGFALPSDREIRELLALARALGINLLDTAPAYGTAEERLGRLLPGPRRDWVIVTKVGEEFRDGRSVFDFTAAATRASVERSLSRLNSDWLDLVLIHSDGEDVRILTEEGALDALLELKREGKVRAVGISSKTVAGGLLALDSCDAVMVTHNPLHQEERPVIRAAHERGRGVLIKKGLLSGHLAALGTDPVETCLRCVFAEAGVSSLVVGTLNPAHLRADVAALERVLAERS